MLSAFSLAPSFSRSIHPFLPPSIRPSLPPPLISPTTHHLCTLERAAGITLGLSMKGKSCLLQAAGATRAASFSNDTMRISDRPRHPPSNLRPSLPRAHSLSVFLHLFIHHFQLPCPSAPTHLSSHPTHLHSQRVGLSYRVWTITVFFSGVDTREEMPLSFPESQ